MRAPLRLAAVIALFMLSCGVGLGIGASVASASDCPPGTSTCALTDFTGSTLGTLYADTSGTLTGSTFSASYEMGVYEGSANPYCSGCHDFDVQISNESTSTSDITQFSLSDFQGVQTDLGSRTDGSTLPGSIFADGTQTPDNGARSAEGDTVTWQFGSGDAVAPGDTSIVLEVESSALKYDGNGTASAGDGSSAGGTYEPAGTKIFTSADPASATTGTTLQDSATLSDTNGFDGTGSITFDLFGPGDNSCQTVIYTETVRMVSSDGPFTTTTGFTPTTPGTYNWTAAFSGDNYNTGAGSTCGAEPVAVTSGRTSQITRPDATCSQFAQASATTLYHVGYTVKKGKVETTSPGDFIYWLKVPSTGGNQSVTVTQFTDEASRPFRLASGSAAFGSGCTTEPVATSQSGGAVTATFDSTGAGPYMYLELRFSTSGVVGEARPSPHPTVDYLFRTHGSSNELDLEP